MVTGYLLAQTASTPLWGKLGDLYGRKRLFQVAIGLFVVGSALAGLSRGIGQLIGFRALQGLGAGGLIVGAQAGIADVVPARQRGRYQALFGGLFAAASAIGPLAGGFLVEHLSWRWVFAVNVPLGSVALALAALALPDIAPRSGPRIDYLGRALLAAAATTLVLTSAWAVSRCRGPHGRPSPWGW